jgi:hypothetical protein
LTYFQFVFAELVDFPIELARRHHACLSRLRDAILDAHPDTRQSCASAIFAINHRRQSYDSPFQKVYMRQKLCICHFCNDLHVAKLRISHFCNNLRVAKLRLHHLKNYTCGKDAHPPFLQ